MANRSPIGPAVAALILMTINFGLMWAAWALPIAIVVWVVIFVLLGIAARRAFAAESLARAGPEAHRHDPPRLD
jgi:hypothetical protein